MRFSLEQLAEAIGMSVQTVRSWRWRYQSDLPLPSNTKALCSMMVTVGRKVQIDSEDVKKWLAQKQGKLRRVNMPGTPPGELEAVAVKLAQDSRDAGANLAAAAFDLGAKLLGMELHAAIEQSKQPS